MGLLDGLLRIAKRTEPSASADVEAALAEAQEALARAEQDLAAARRRYDEALLDASAAVAVKAHEAVVRAQVEVDRTGALTRVLAERLNEAREAEAEAERRARYERAAAEAKAAAKRLEREYPKAAAAIVSLFEALAQANAAIAAVNANLPAGAEPLTPPEMVVRGLPAVGREIVSAEPVLRWHFAQPRAHWGAVEERDIARIEKRLGSRRGVLDVQIEGRTVECPVIFEARERRIEYRPEASAHRPDPLHLSIRLPGLRAGEPPFWLPAGLGSHIGPLGLDGEAVLRAIEERREAAARPPADPRGPRSPEVMFEAMTPPDPEPDVGMDADEAEAA